MSTGNSIVKVAASGGDVEPVIRGEAKQFLSNLTLLPDGKGFLYLAMDFGSDQQVRVGHLYAGRIGSSERTLVGNMSSRARLFFSEARTNGVPPRRPS